ncbi:MAG: HAD family hydrolase, partial [Candidatus Nanohaloarchaea archaeon]
ENAMEVLGTENVVMAGDSEFDIRGAKNAGIDSILVDRGKNVGAEPDYTVESLDEIPGRVSER